MHHKVVAESGRTSKFLQKSADILVNFPSSVEESCFTSSISTLPLE